MHTDITNKHICAHLPCAKISQSDNSTSKFLIGHWLRQYHMYIHRTVSDHTASRSSIRIHKAVQVTQLRQFRVTFPTGERQCTIQVKHQLHTHLHSILLTLRILVSIFLEKQSLPLLNQANFQAKLSFINLTQDLQTN